ncbi:peroxiredoxin family protein [Rufibacter tibetensis]|uniref:Alkyl hydroperoxide reductase n=1 Tax=Rufibacter tibetensis TaxID=512763 RepID=A0A0P0C051_9BACT|nr:TlpA disulfide reductase family protein [Rufibacter tibetensis]ALI97815.1 alkyl hydroperoxide reductase [Rufibacter tibetensis]
MNKIKFFKYSIFTLVSAALSLPACTSSSTTEPELATGSWRGIIQVSNQDMPFNFTVSEEGGKKVAYLINADEKILIDEISTSEDSVRLQMHIFDAALIAKIDGNKLSGRWERKDQATPYSLPFSAEHEKTTRFSENPAKPTLDISGKWEVQFTKEDGKTYPAIGEFVQKGNALTGTFLTNTGDYRYLQGEVDGNKLKLSAFDGAHAYLFNASGQPNGTLAGDFYAGQSSHETWTAKRNPNFKLASAEKLTYLKPGYDRLDFSFPDLNGKKVSLTDPQFKGKVVVAQIFGSWCPNCMDETKFLAPWYEKNKNRGVEVVGIGYEVSPDFDKAKVRVEKMRERLNVPYTLLIGGTKDKELVAKSLPALNHVLSFPTTIFIDKQGKVRKIHTGFSGPGTGKYYEEFVQEFNKTIDELVAEK